MCQHTTWGWDGVGWGNNVQVTCAHRWCYDEDELAYDMGLGWGGVVCSQYITAVQMKSSKKHCTTQRCSCNNTFACHNEHIFSSSEAEFSTGGPKDWHPHAKHLLGSCKKTNSFNFSHAIGTATFFLQPLPKLRPSCNAVILTLLAVRLYDIIFGVCLPRFLFAVTLLSVLPSRIVPGIWLVPGLL